MKLENKKYSTTIKQGYDPVEGYFYYVEIPDEMLESLGWNEHTKLSADVKMGTNGNVLVIART